MFFLKFNLNVSFLCLLKLQRLLIYFFSITMDYYSRFIVRVGWVGLHLLILKYVFLRLYYFHDSFFTS
jgi:hypothetical protein